MTLIQDEHAMKSNDMAANNDKRALDGKSPPVKSAMLARLLVTCVALAAAAFHLAWSNPKFDGITVALLVVALVPWLGAVIDTLELPGGWKVQYRDIEQRLAETETGLAQAHAETQHIKGAAASASQKAAVALATSKPDSRTRNAYRQLDELVAQYNKVRSAQESSNQRTEILTKIVGRMVALSGQLSSYHWRKALQSDDPGMRVAGYAWLYARPNRRAAQLLVETVTAREDTHFGQYWGLEALQKCMPLADASTAAALTPQLRGFLSKLPPGSDRHYELSNLVEQLAGLSER